MPQIRCFGHDLIHRTFDYRHEWNDLSKSYDVVVETIPPPANGERFDMELKRVDANTLKVETANHNNSPFYKQMGIPEALIPAIGAELQKTIISSVGPKKAPAGEFRIKNATQYWERMSLHHQVEYDDEADIFRLPFVPPVIQQPAPAVPAEVPALPAADAPQADEEEIS